MQSTIAASNNGVTPTPKAHDKRRSTGFSSPLHPLQIITWMLYILLIVHFFAFLLPILQRLLRDYYDNYRDQSINIAVQVIYV